MALNCSIFFIFHLLFTFFLQEIELTTTTANANATGGSGDRGTNQQKQILPMAIEGASTSGLRVSFLIVSPAVVALMIFVVVVVDAVSIDTKF